MVKMMALSKEDLKVLFVALDERQIKLAELIKRQGKTKIRNDRYLRSVELLNRIEKALKSTINE